MTDYEAGVGSETILIDSVLHDQTLGVSKNGISISISGIVSNGLMMIHLVYRRDKYGWVFILMQDIYHKNYELGNHLHCKTGMVKPD